MPRAHHPAAKAAAAARYVPLLADPLNPIAKQVGKAVAAEVKSFVCPPTKGSRHASTGAGESKSVDLEAYITVLVAKALDRSLSARTAEGKALRMALIARLANAEAGDVSVPELKPAVTDGLLTTAQAAAKLEVSRPHVSMLCDQGKLGEVVMTEGGHRRIRASAVQAYLEVRTTQLDGAKSPREAGMEAGLYDVPEGHFTNVIRASAGAAKAAKVAVKADRKTRP